VVQLKYAWYQQDRDLTLTDEQKSEQNRELHQKAADRILKLCGMCFLLFEVFKFFRSF
jgi:hypothetical protein